MLVLEEVVVVGQPATVSVDVPALLDAHGAGADELADRPIDAVHRAAETLCEPPATGEAPSLLVGVPGQEGEQPDGAVGDLGVEEPGRDAAERAAEYPPAHRLVQVGSLGRSVPSQDSGDG
jgi:hypothetical protein